MQSSLHHVRSSPFSKVVLVAMIVAVLAGAKPAQAATSSFSSCQCTDYVYSQRPDIARGMGNAKQWISSAANRGYTYDQIPQVGDVAVFLNGAHGFDATYGHVAMVTWVNDTHTSYNIAGWDGLKADCVLQSYSNLSITPNDWFIHKQGANPPPAAPPPAQPPLSPRPSNGQVQFSPVSPAQAGQTVTITAAIQAGTNFRAARLLIDYQVASESSATQFSYSWNTTGFLPSVHNIRLEMTTTDDPSWAQPSYYETTYLLREASPPPNSAPTTPSAISPSDGQTLTANPQLCWKNNGDPDGDQVMTRAEVSGPQSWIGPWLEGDHPCWAPPDPMSGQYSWSVRARDSKGAESNGSVGWTFTIQAAAPSGVPVAFQNVSFVIPAGLAEGAKGEIVPEVIGVIPAWSAPKHILFTLAGYSLPAPNRGTVEVFPAAEYAAVNPFVKDELPRLRAVLAAPASPLTEERVPHLACCLNSGQLIAAQPQVLRFHGGTGVRAISEYAQYAAPITKNEGIYHYEGLTADGKYLVAVLLPVTLPLKSTAANPSADGIPFPSEISNFAGFESYYQGMTDLLIAASPDSYQPSLIQMDALIQSLTVGLK
jgi:hypothetical protein